jgi:hypothetical protein
VYDTSAGAPGGLEILEFVNSQLLEFRYYDQLLDAELARTYAALQAGSWRPNWLSRRYTRAARQVHSLFIDVNELTDRAENALKIAGDVYAARVFGLARPALASTSGKRTCATSSRRLTTSIALRSNRRRSRGASSSS